MKIIFVVKTIFYLLCIGVFVIYFFTYIGKFTSTKSLSPLQELDVFGEKSGLKYYILLWSSGQETPFKHMAQTLSTFISKSCHHNNCLVTSNEHLLSDVRLYDVIVFDGTSIANLEQEYFPKERLPYQKYVFTSVHSSDMHPVCSKRFDGYFNWTWTYRLDSEINLSFILIKDNDGNTVGPKKDMHWIEWDAMKPVNNEFIEIVETKTKAVVWFQSNCEGNEITIQFGEDLQKYLAQYKVDLDIFTYCGDVKCSNDIEEECFRKLGYDYQFFLCFENYFSEDYVTDNLLIPLQYAMVPIVYGGANYTRFLPNKSYLNAKEMGVVPLGNKIIELIDNQEEYLGYFRWRNHYSYTSSGETEDTNEFCQICALVNSDQLRRPSVYQNFRKWWDSTESCSAHNAEIHKHL